MQSDAVSCSEASALLSTPNCTTSHTPDPTADEAETPDTTVTVPAASRSGTSCTPTLTAVLAALYVAIGLAAVLVIVFVVKRMRERRRARLESHQLDECFDSQRGQALALTPERSARTRFSRYTRRSARPSARDPSASHQQPPSPHRRFLEPLLRVLSGTRHHEGGAALPLVKPTTSRSTSSGADVSLSESIVDISVSTATALETWRLADNSVQIDDVVNRGQFDLHAAVIYSANQPMRHALATRLRPPLATMRDHTLELELAVRDSTAITHPNIVAFLGVCSIHTELYMLFEQPARGDLEQLLAAMTAQHDDDASSWAWFTTSAVCPRSKAVLALDVVNALVYLHARTPKRFVRDLRAKRVWLSADFTAQLVCCTQELQATSSLVHDPSELHSRSSGASLTLASSASSPTAPSRMSSIASHSHIDDSVAWLAPELLRGQQDVSEQTDMYALGVLLTELDMNERPFARGIDALDGAQVATLVSSGCIRPALSLDCPAPIRALILKCLSFSPTDRPQAVDVQLALRKLVQEQATPTIDTNNDVGDNENESEPTAAESLTDVVIAGVDHAQVTVRQD